MYSVYKIICKYLKQVAFICNRQGYQYLCLQSCKTMVVHTAVECSVEFVL